MSKTNDTKPAKMPKEPWLAGLDEDWPSQPSSPCSLPHSPTLPTGGNPQSARKCIGCSERSRIPKPPEGASPKAKGRSTPRGARQGQARRGGSTTPTSTRASPSPRAARTSNTPSKPSPKTSGTQPTPARKKPSSTPLKNMMSIKSNSTASVRTDEQGTVQVRASKEDTQDTPEWKRRLVRGELSADEQCDLFAPIALENIFRQPATTAPSGNRSSFNALNYTESEAQVRISGSKAGKTVQRKVSFKNKHDKGGHREQSTHLSVRAASSKRAKFGLDGSLDGSIDADIRLRSASGESELRHEDLTPIFLSANNDTVDHKTGSGILQSALKQINETSASSEKHDSDVTKQYRENGDASAFQPNDLLGISSPYLPENLSTGTEEAIETHPFVTFERGGFSEGSFRMQQLSPSSFPSHLQSSIITNSKIRSSPPTSARGATPQSPENSIAVPAVTFSPVGEPGSERPHTGNMSSPLKLFDNHDTFTNKRLLRRMSQFEETFQDASEEDEPASPSLVARRTRTAKRSLPNLRRRGSKPRRNTARPVTQDAADPRMNRFGHGQLDEFDFANKLMEPTTIPSLSFQHASLPEQQQNQRTFSRDVRNENLRKAKSFDDLPESGASTRILQRRRLSRRSGSRQSSLGIYQSNPNVRRVSNMSSRTTAPKRRRTIQQSQEQALDATELIDSILNLSIEEKATRDVSQTSDHFSYSIQGTPDSERMPGRRNRVASANAPSTNPDESKEDILSLDGHKRSLTTQDFLDEATKVMSIIRAKSKYKNGLASVEESGITGHDDEDDEQLTEASSRENLSRPPSRDGVDMRKFREPRQLHPRVVSHLKKYADIEDTEQLMASVMSDLYKEQNSVADGKADVSIFSGEAMSSPENVRILPQRKRKHSDDDLPMHSIPTISSNGSNTKGVIASDMVSHLIPEHVNGMNYDKTSKSWVKEKVNRAAGVMRSEDSEDDPFGSIPDLSVDELEEIKRAQVSASPSKSSQSVDTRQATKSNHEPGFNSAGAQRPATRDGAPFVLDSSSVQSKTTRFTSSGPQPETRATSWGTGDITVNIDQLPSPNSAKAKTQTPLQQGHIVAQSKQPKGSGVKRVSTISFSSPLVSHISYADDVDYLRTSEISAGEQRDESKVDSKVPGVAPSRRASLDGRPFVGRPISRIDEQNEESNMEMSLVRRNSTGQVDSTPLSQRMEKSMVYSSSARGDNYSFHFSPLSDFTIHQTDDPMHPEVSYVAQRAHPTSLRQIHGTYSLATEDLIKHITDVEPTEPYWEHLRRLSLRDKGIVILRYLNKFCPRLEGLDVSENELSQLDGAPSTLRELRVQHNCLTNLTSWGHLINLQYLDISGNQLESLDGFSGLIHLRELRANNNRIRNVKGIFGLNGLLRLELRHNNLTTVDFEGSELTRLGEIDLSNNQINSIQHLEYLPVMETLDMSANQIRELQTPQPLRSLRTLKVSSNRLSSFDASYYRNLRLLYLDNNYLTTVSGLSKCGAIEVFSIREQFAGQLPELGASLDIDLSLLCDARKIFLSSNRLSERTLAPSAPMLALQLLDVASCGIQKLPSSFGQCFPNLRVLNLNFNSVSDLVGIANMKGLSRLAVAGNRISRLRMLCQVVARIGRSSQHDYSTLRTIDIRNNPLTLGFYPPQVSGSGRADSHMKMLEEKLQRAHKRQHRIESGVDLLSTIAPGETETGDNALVGFTNTASNGGKVTEVEIDDPYTLPPADAEADQKYRLRLDGPTKRKRMTVEVMLYAGTGGSIRMLDGLDLKSLLEDERAEVDEIWSKLEQLGVFTKRQPNALCQ